MLSTVTWVNSSGGDWNTGSNWSTGLVPGSSDDAVINVSGNPTITFSSGSDTVNSITSNSPLTLSGGTLTVNTTVQVNNTFTINGGTLVGATVNAGSGGQGITAGTSSNSVLDNVTSNANISVSNGYLGLKDNFALGVSDTATVTSSTLACKNSVTVQSGTINLDGSTVTIPGGSTLTLDPGVIGRRQRFRRAGRRKRQRFLLAGQQRHDLWTFRALAPLHRREQWQFQFELHQRGNR